MHCCCSVPKLCPTLCNPMDCSTPGFPVLHYPQSLLKLKSIKSVMLLNHLILCHPLLLLTSIFPSIRVFPNESAFCIRWPKYWHFSFSSVSHQLRNNPSLLICQQGREFYFPKCPWIFHWCEKKSPFPKNCNVFCPWGARDDKKV